MKIDLNEEQKMIRDMAETFARKDLYPLASIIDEEERLPGKIIDSLYDLGFIGMLVPEEYGGTGAGPISYALALTEIAGGCASTAVTMGVSNMVAEAINMYGNRAQKEKYLSLMLGGRGATGAFALTEPGAGSDAGAMRTFAQKKGDRYIINGSKVFITNGSRAGVILVMALTGREPREITAFIVEPSYSGFSVGKKERKMGLKGSDTVELVFTDMDVPEENVLGNPGEGFKVAMTSLDGGRIGIGCQCVGIAGAALSRTIDYAKERRQFGVPIKKFQSIQMMIAESALDIESARLLTLRASNLKGEGKSYSREASMAKLFSSEMGYRVCHRAVQIHGGYGYMADYPLERHLRDVKVTTIYEGTSEVQRIVISRSLLNA